MEVFKPDLVITVGWIEEYVPEKREIIREIVRQYNCLHVYWAVEDIQHLQTWSLPMVKAVQPDAVFTINADCIPFYENLGIPAFHLEFGYNPSVEAYVEHSANSRYCHDIAVVANTYDIWENTSTYRWQSVDILIRPLIEKGGYDLVLWGKGWEQAPWQLSGHKTITDYCGGSISFLETFSVYQRSKIILNLQNENRFTTQLTSRTFEIMGCGGVQLTTRVPAVQQLFVDRQHLILTNSPSETLELVDYYLVQEQERHYISQNGRAEILAKHTYKHRADYMLSCLGLKKQRTGGKTISTGRNLRLLQIQPPSVDACVMSGRPEEPSPESAVLVIGREWHQSGRWSSARAYLAFHLPELPAGCEIDSAFLYLWLNWKAPVFDLIGCYPVLEAWNEETLTWSNQPVQANQPVDRVAVEGNAASSWLAWNITQIVKQWIKSERANYGLCLRSIDEDVLAGSLQTPASRNWTGSKEFKPYLAILYWI
ncbi:MAG: glycosyltransferase family protein [Bacillota bacterium]|jgi:spore maturation protein CgeB